MKSGCKQYKCRFKYRCLREFHMQIVKSIATYLHVPLDLNIRLEMSQKRCDEKRKQSNKLTLPSISPDTNNTSCLGCLETTSGCDICHNVDARRQSRHLRTRPWQERPQSPINDTDMTSQREEKESHKSTDVVTLYQTEIEKARWLSEQQLEKALVGTFFEPPRLVLVSSKIPKCQYIPKVLLEGENVLYIVYDFDTWSFIDITDAIQKKLESIKSGCKAKSICLLCQRLTYT
ncbi:hypothetical protein KUTeg_021612 [Tegillarca granosa]|uniref:Uncharacterized protein n=1 Tax=Tegillarca granosa TaxID=220873 RepID=A0ABQ9E3T9_TEGGR|nr:hypothetical protein KUTeg_021612 [Tegillarca granosa]